MDRPWSKEEDELLLEEFASGDRLQMISTRHGRTRAAIINRLRRFNLIVEVGRAYHVISPHPWCYLKDAKDVDHKNAPRNNNAKGRGELQKAR